MALTHLRAGDVEVGVDPEHGGRIASLKFGRTQILVTTAINPLTWGVYPMVPYAGRVRDAQLNFVGTTHSLRANSDSHSLHGTVFDRAWTLTHSSPESLTMEIDLGHHWPFDGTVSHVVRVEDDAVWCQLTVTAADTMPAQVGWHPWFRRPQSVETHFSGMLQRDEFGIATSDVVPVPDGKVDDCFIGSTSAPRVTIKSVTVEIESDCSHWVRYDSPSGDVCIEPQSGPPNGVNTAPHIIEAGSSLTRWMRITRVR